MDDSQRQQDRTLMGIGMAGAFHGTISQSHQIFTHFLEHGSAEAKEAATAGMALLAVFGGHHEQANVIIDKVAGDNPEILGLRAFVYRKTRNGNCDHLLDKMDGMGGDAAEFAEAIRNLSTE